MTDPDMGSWQYTYDKAGNLITQTDAKGQTISFEYNDGLNRLTQKTYVNSSPPERVVYAYDDPTVPYSKGKLTKVSRLVGNPEVEVAADFVLEYDLMQRVKISKKKIEANELTFEKNLDSAGRMVSITYPGNRTYSYEYDVAGDLLYVKDNSSGNKLVEYSGFTALGQHRVADSPKPNNVSVKTSYEYYPETGRIKTLKTEKLVNGELTETFQNLKYQKIDENPGYDGAGNITVLQDLLNNITHNLTYDHLNRLTLANGVGTNAYTQSFTYDRIGNIDSRIDDGVSTDYTYNYGNRPHAVNSTTGFINITDIQYDANGNMTQRVQGGVTTTIGWDYDNKPISITKGGTAVSFIYDGNGQRVKKQSSISGATYYFGDLCETRGGVETIHVFAGSKRIASVFLDGTTQFYHTNHLGSSSVVTDQYGGRKEQIEYYPFGVYRAAGNINGTYDFDPNFPDVFYTFTGQEDDDDLGLYNYGARLYDPVLGKFISPDSVVQAPDDPQTLNRYSYARNNPIIYTDPSGNIAIIDDIVEAIAAIVAAIAASKTATAAVAIVGGAALGAATSAITGGNIGMGALTGAISGLLFYGAGNIIPGISSALGATGSKLAETAVTVAVHTVAGAVSGGINSAITGSDIGLGVLTGAVAAGIGSVTGGALSYFEVDQFGYQLVARTVAGGIAGGIVSEIYGGNFWQGFAQGAATAAAEFLFNWVMHPKGAKTYPWLKGKPLPGQLMTPGLLVFEGTYIGGYAIGIGGYFAPEFAALAVRYGTIYILGNPNTYQNIVQFVTNVSTMAPPTPSATGASYAGKAVRFYYEE